MFRSLRLDYFKNPSVFRVYTRVTFTMLSFVRHAPCVLQAVVYVLLEHQSGPYDVAQFLPFAPVIHVKSSSHTMNEKAKQK